MPSLAAKTWSKRFGKLKNMGKRRKRRLRRGSTPPFPIHLEPKVESPKSE